MTSRPGKLVLIAFALLATACGTNITATSTTIDADTAFTTAEEPIVQTAVGGAPATLTRIDRAIALNVAVHEGESPVVAWITHDTVAVAALDVVSGGLVDERDISGDLMPIAHPIERPAVALYEGGRVDVAFTSLQSDGTSVFLSRDGARPQLISGPAHHETNLVHLMLDPGGSPVLAWLEDATLSVARTTDSGIDEVEEVDDHTCDCCNPVPVFVDQSLVVAYRDFDRVNGEVVRNVAAVRSSDGGQSFDDPVQIADDDWFLDGCPFTGPDIIDVDGTLVTAWMDARQSVHPDQSATTIWVDRSEDGGATFGDDLAVASGAVHRWPALAVDDSGVIHLVWETQGPDGGLSYAWSSDVGLSWSEPMLLVDRGMSDGGAPRSPSAAFHGGQLIVTWADVGQGYVAVWPTTTPTS